MIQFICFTICVLFNASPIIVCHVFDFFFFFFFILILGYFIEKSNEYMASCDWWRIK